MLMNVFSSVTSRYKDYNVLAPDLSKGARGYRRWLTLTNVCLAVSVIANVVFYYNYAWGWPSPIDNYQALNDGPLTVDPVPIDRSNPYENTIVTSLYSDAFATAVATLGHSLNKVNSTAGRLLFYLPDQVSPHALCTASASGFVPHAVSRIPPPHAGVHRHFLDQYAKLNLWTLDAHGVRSLVYLDADTLVHHNFDELFALPFAFGAVPDVYTDARGYTVNFNAGVLFLRPSTDRFRSMVPQIASARYPMEEAEQAFLNLYYGPDAVRLPYVYNANLAIKIRSPALWADLKKKARIVHYTLSKPFLQGDYAKVEMDKLEKNAQVVAKKRGGLYKEEVEDWMQMWRETRHTYRETLDECNSVP
ncbi:nucleotide-diphospho-sugar transferase [Amylocystis lapponica]|nr:nucleotide-diphospho-sugar transferase [Amylocystis lapponica]